eukprot:10512327-Ditylum_brightwellii.AAC.1
MKKKGGSNTMVKVSSIFLKIPSARSDADCYRTSNWFNLHRGRQIRQLNGSNVRLIIYKDESQEDRKQKSPT